MGSMPVVVEVVAVGEHVVEGFFGDGFCSAFDGFPGGLADELVEGVHVAAGAWRLIRIHQQKTEAVICDLAITRGDGRLTH
ncbi:hypothetical protein Sviol_60590 [Streptomyces violascens]|uniref:Uncharacterized protein n=1 Tax=Streptomyces violascens TaxID=67381 RepID=A0ABQ3QWJ2_9ACTN|nr:hypothetical protein Sviol_60590 [Streptomyces violascens]